RRAHRPPGPVPAVRPGTRRGAHRPRVRGRPRGAGVTQAVFGRDYASVYDELYQDKDYEAETDLIEHVFGLYAQGKVRRVLDLGCGTGGHAVPLAQRGYDVVGVDRSPDMLQRAKQRGSSARFELGEISNLDLGERFDA